MTEDRPTAAVFRPDDERLARAVESLESLGVKPIADPMLAVEPTGNLPRTDADAVVFTSKTGAELVAGEWTPGDATVCAIGEPTADALRANGTEVDVVPETYSSTGLVETLGERVDGSRVEVARSDHGSDVLLDGLESAGAYVHETVLYRLVRPERAGESVELAADGGLDAALFTSSLTVEHFLAIATERGHRERVLDGLADAVVGAIGEPTRETASDHGIEVDVVPETADFESLAAAVVERLDR
ncbi:uroporphyrinogen-III synthase [Halorhabdus tiamatea]|uniref:Uroporphyrinogen-III synthase n=1 Tax=Halorhabdus tiamatea SARL4B TaxID=1033806 RepID=F7PKH1_9EURY|nr:uroporphyrinogen-III synthase [Halorhabdus tiamatea]CCQ32921.1 uroporphyrinogen-III synthase [Halorhabdus tiamatea SARL4B]